MIGEMHVVVQPLNCVGVAACFSNMSLHVRWAAFSRNGSFTHSKVTTCHKRLIELRYVFLNFFQLKKEQSATKIIRQQFQSETYTVRNASERSVL